MSCNQTQTDNSSNAAPATSSGPVFCPTVFKMLMIIIGMLIIIFIMMLKK
jgi:hypothetical protein